MFLFKSNFCSNGGVLYLPIVLLSGALTVIPFISKMKNFDINASADVQVEAILLMPKADINDCSQLVGGDYGRFKMIKDEVTNYCGAQSIKDISYLTSNVINVMYSVLYNEFSLASAFIPVPKRKNECLNSIDQFLMMCPEQKIYFSQKNLQMLRDFERKQ